MSPEIIVVIILVAFTIVKVVGISKVTKLMTDKIKRDAEEAKQEEEEKK